MKPWLFAGFALLPGCLHTPCTDAESNSVCTGEIVADLTGQKPIFDVVGLDEVAPDYLSVAPNGSCEGADPTVWEIRGFDLEATPITYGDAPENARVLVEPEDLEDGVVYDVSFGKMDGSGWAANNRWSGLLTWGPTPTFAVFPDVCTGV